MAFSQLHQEQIQLKEKKQNHIKFMCPWHQITRKNLKVNMKLSVNFPGEGYPVMVGHDTDSVCSSLDFVKYK